MNKKKSNKKGPPPSRFVLPERFHERALEIEQQIEKEKEKVSH